MWHGCVCVFCVSCACPEPLQGQRNGGAPAVLLPPLVVRSARIGIPVPAAGSVPRAVPGGRGGGRGRRWEHWRRCRSGGRRKLLWWVVSHVIRRHAARVHDFTSLSLAFRRVVHAAACASVFGFWLKFSGLERPTDNNPPPCVQRAKTWSCIF